MRDIKLAGLFARADSTIHACVRKIILRGLRVHRECSWQWILTHFTRLFFCYSANSERFATGRGVSWLWSLTVAYRYRYRYTVPPDVATDDQRARWLMLPLSRANFLCPVFRTRGRKPPLMRGIFFFLNVN